MVKIKAHLYTVKDGVPLEIKYEKNIYIRKSGYQNRRITGGNTKMVRCWIRFKNIKQFHVDDIKEAFSEMKNYSKNQLIELINPLIQNKELQQLSQFEFKVLKNE